MWRVAIPIKRKISYIIYVVLFFFLLFFTGKLSDLITNKTYIYAERFLIISIWGLIIGLSAMLYKEGKWLFKWKTLLLFGLPTLLIIIIIWGIPTLQILGLWPFAVSETPQLIAIFRDHQYSLTILSFIFGFSISQSFYRKWNKAMVYKSLLRLKIKTVLALCHDRLFIAIMQDVSKFNRILLKGLVNNRWKLSWRKTEHSIWKAGWA